MRGHHAQTHTLTRAHTPSSVGNVEVVVGSEQVPREDLREPDVQITSVGSDILVGAAVARLPRFRDEAAVTRKHSENKPLLPTALVIKCENTYNKANLQ